MLFIEVSLNSLTLTVLLSERRVIAQRKVLIEVQNNYSKLMISKTTL